MLGHRRLALLATDWAEDDIRLIQASGLLSNMPGPLAAQVLRRRRPRLGVAAARLHEAIVHTEVDDDLIDHPGRLPE